MNPIRVAILWHQHQPDYRDGNQFRMPWAWLHATKDYLEMAEHFERHPNMRGTINLVPSLLKQIEEYIAGDVGDRVLDLMTKDAATLWSGDQIFMRDNFFLANQRVIDESPRYQELFDKANRPNWQLDFELQDYRDLTVHYSLAWTGDISRMSEPFKSLVAQDRGFTELDKQSLAHAQMENVRKIIPLHKKLAKKGQIELTTTPFYHPILPLLIDTNSAREPTSDMLLPHNRFQSPEDADEQIWNALEYFKKKIGIEPKGMWPSEGSISMAALALIRKNGFQWAASDESVLGNSIGSSSVTAGKIAIKPEHAKYFPCRVATSENEIIVFFRDHRLSDDIGFTYQSWNADDAVEHFVGNLLSIRSALIDHYGDDILHEACISVILDGENCWEYYPHNGFDFLGKLYSTLTSTLEIQPVTFHDAISSSRRNNLPKLSNITAGSWINANFKIWIGHPEDNISWDALYAAKTALETARTQARKLKSDARTKALANIAAAHEELMIAEGSDWNWWYGDDNFSVQNALFDELYRMHLSEVYRKLGLTVPTDLTKPISGRFSNTTVSATGGAMHKAT